MLLAGDIGGTKTLLGLFEPAPDRPVSVEVGEFTTLDYDDLVPMIREFLKASGVEPSRVRAATFGVAGAVTDQVARLTNVPWLVDAAALSQAGGLSRVHLLNDLEAMAHSVPVLEPQELSVLQQGVAPPGGNGAVIAAGTGLGQALLHNIDGHFVPSPTEAGHADWAARTSREIAMLTALTRVYGRASVEHVVSGPGLVNIYQFTHDAFGNRAFMPAAARRPGFRPRRSCRRARAPASGRSTTRPTCPRRSAARRWSVAARNASKRWPCSSPPTVPKRATWRCAPWPPPASTSAAASPALQDGTFIDAFRAKDPMADFVATFPVAVILNPEAGLLGAAVHANAQ